LVHSSPFAQQTIEQQQGLLVAHRRRLAYRLRQQARLGDYAPPEVALGLVGALFTALAGAMVFGLVFGMAGGLSGGEVEAKIAPNQGIGRSGRSALLSGLIIGGVFGLGNELIYGPLFGMAAQLAPSLIFGLIFGLIGALAYGGFACLSHLALRVVLWQSGALPWNCAWFLDYAATRILVRKVGGGYMFVHRLLQEYFASLA
jgi:hypothetical protein